MANDKCTFQNTSITIRSLLDEIDNGYLGLPEIQRPFVWSDAQARNLFDSLFHGYPAGTLMLWDAGEGEAVGRGKKSTAFHQLIVDGQQRLTSLFAVIKGKSVLDKNKHERKIKIAFKPETGEFEVCSAAHANSPEWVPDISEYYARATSSWDLIHEFLERRQIDDEEMKRKTIPNNIQHMLDILNIYLPAIVISGKVDGETVADIFVRVNSGGLKLKQSDFIFTLMSVYCPEGRDKLDDFDTKVHTAGNKLNGYVILPTSADMLRVALAVAFRRARLHAAYEILRGKDLTKRGNVTDPPEVMAVRRDEQFATFNAVLNKVLDEGNWKSYLDCLTHAGFRSRRMLNNTSACTYAYALYLIGRYDFNISHLELQPTLARWFFMSLLTSRYTSGAEGVMEADLANIKECKDAKAFLGYLDSEIKAVLTNDFWSITLPRNLAASTATSPAQSAFWAAQVLLKADSLFINDLIGERLDSKHDAKHSALERHHLFPKAHLVKTGVSRNMQNQLANMALLDWHINNAIKDSAPPQYAPKLTDKWLEGLNSDTGRMQKALRLNALPEGWEGMEYQEFLENRRALMAAIIREGFETL